VEEGAALHPAMFARMLADVVVELKKATAASPMWRDGGWALHAVVTGKSRVAGRFCIRQGASVGTNRL